MKILRTRPATSRISLWLDTVTNSPVCSTMRSTSGPNGSPNGSPNVSARSVGTFTLTSILAPVAAASLALCLLSGCNEAVRDPKVATYRIEGKLHSDLYPLSVKEVSEDVLVRLKENTSAPVVYTIDAEGKQIAFNYQRDGDTLIIPGKFDHLILTRPDAPSIDIYREADITAKK